MADEQTETETGNDAELLRQIAVRMEGSPFLQLSGMRVVAVSVREATVELQVTEKLLQGLRVMHGGMMGALIDTAIGTAAFGALRGTGRVVTVEYKVNFYRPTRLGDVLTARGEVLHLGRSTVAGEAYVTDQNGQLVSHGTGTFMRVTESLEPITGSNQPQTDSA